MLPLKFTTSSKISFNEFSYCHMLRNNFQIKAFKNQNSDFIFIFLMQWNTTILALLFRFASLAFLFSFYDIIKFCIL